MHVVPVCVFGLQVSYGYAYKLGAECSSAHAFRRQLASARSGQLADDENLKNREVWCGLNLPMGSALIARHGSLQLLAHIEPMFSS